MDQCNKESLKLNFSLLPFPIEGLEVTNGLNAEKREISPGGLRSRPKERGSGGLPGVSDQGRLDGACLGLLIQTLPAPFRE